MTEMPRGAINLGAAAEGVLAMPREHLEGEPVILNASLLAQLCDFLEREPQLAGENAVALGLAAQDVRVRTGTHANALARFVRGHETAEPLGGERRFQLVAFDLHRAGEQLFQEPPKRTFLTRFVNDAAQVDDPVLAAGIQVAERGIERHLLMGFDVGDSFAQHGASLRGWASGGNAGVGGMFGKPPHKKLDSVAVPTVQVDPPGYVTE